MSLATAVAKDASAIVAVAVVFPAAVAKGAEVARHRGFKGTRFQGTELSRL